MPGGSDAERRLGVARAREEAVLERQSLRGLRAQTAMHRSRKAHHRAQLPRGCERGHAPPRHRRSHMDELRKCLAEHPFATLKWLMGDPRFLRGLVKAKA